MGWIDIWRNRHPQVFFVKPLIDLTRAPWKLNAFWLNLLPSHIDIEKQISDLFSDHEAFSDPLLLWDTLKAILRGVFISEIRAIKSASRKH